ncbi:hypothetical protein ACJMK2_019413 [Sinanodonta woodiana]|uniref:Uncharacterized protein n=1 Tax=Sinanodonta woodiana TaxID=1069815 RepID=A0ABD3UHR9_SINWO
MADKSLSEKMAVASETQASTHPVRETDPKDDSEQRLHLSAVKPMVDAQPKKKGTFKITNVMKNDADGDSMDDLDESHTEVTEDVSSDILDISRATDNGQDTPSEDIVFQGLSNEMDAKENKDKTGSDMHSRFRVVKIETKEPFFRGRWRCHDYLDTMQVMSERSDTKLAEEGNSGSSSAASSIHYVHGVDDPSKNPLLSDACGTVPVPVPNETQNVVKHESFQPIHPAPASVNNGTLVVPAFFQENPSVTGISSQSQKFIQHSNSQQNIPQTTPVLADSSQNLQQGQLTQGSHVPQQPLFMATPTQIGTVAELVPNIAVASIGIPSMPSIYPTIQSMSQLPSVVSSVSGTTNMAHPQVSTSTYQTFLHPDNQTLPVSHSGHLEHVNVSGLIPTSQISKATFSDSPVLMPFNNAVQVLDRDLKDTVLQNTPLLTPLSVGDSAEEPNDR